MLDTPQALTVATRTKNLVRNNLATFVALAWITFGILAAVRMYQALSHPLYDLNVYAHAIRLLRSGDSLYDYFDPDGFPFTYPPFAGLVLYPLGFIPERLAHAAWTCATIGAAVGLAKLLVSVRPPLLMKLPAPLRIPVVSGVLIGSVPFLSNILSGQISIFLTLLVAIDLLAKLPPRWRGVATGIAAAIKLTPLAFIPLLWFSGRRRAAITALGTAMGCTLLAFLVFPADSLRYWSTEMFDTSRIGDLTISGNQSINGVLQRLWTDGAATTALCAVLSLIVVALAYPRAARLAREGDHLTALIIVGAMSVAVSPVSWKHHQFWLVLAIFLVVSTASRRAALTWISIVFLLTFFPPQFWRDLVADNPVRLLLENMTALLAIAIATFVPFRSNAPSPAPTTDRE